MRSPHSYPLVAPLTQHSSGPNTIDDGPDPFPSRLSSLLAGAAVALGIGLIGPGATRAESSVLLASPQLVQSIAATTFDKHGTAVGQSSFELETEEDGNQLMRVTLAIEGGGTNVSQAILSPVRSARADKEAEAAETRSPHPYGPAGGLRLVEERSQSTRADGVSLPLLVIDHKKGRVSCYPSDRERSEGQHVDIPEEDRVVNVPMQLLFLPLVRGETDATHFQIATCADGPVLHSMIAVAGPTIERDGRKIVEIKYGPDLGKTVAWFASRLLPSFSFWFDADDGAYLGHRMPLHRKGPEILLVRQGLTPPDIGVD
jgi:hypothetical protein